MPKKKGADAKKLTLKAAKKAIHITQDGRRRLTLSNMGLTIFPKCLFKLSNVDELDLSRNLIQKLPDNIGSFTSLRWLDLHSNKLESVPESIGNLVGLTHLNLANNCLTTTGLPSSLGFLCNLKSLNLGLNQLNALPPTLERLDHLQELGLSDNLFAKLPEFVQTLRNLTKLNVTRNPFTYVQAKDERMKKEKSEQKDEVYLVHESRLCKQCLKTCKAETERVLRGGRRRGKRCERVDMLGEKKKTFLGLMTPNSVAAVTQDVWRIKAKKQTAN
ncbi:leucine-rich repeat-containing protein 18 [Girardinichthys multiradiatus]|uniref:leucine-rich repeat-containing protein 18 n=1 Tax=Girardinichthys multiradiatus TaxID=208333 RepID=UPI001FAB8443|nr:leucine-rich repeat-containing protein 18 [Girardinichthys multiradiatus]